MFCVGIERNFPIRSSATAIGLIYAYISIHGQRLFSGLLVLWLLSFQPLDLEARIEMLIAVESG